MQSVFGVLLFWSVYGDWIKSGFEYENQNSRRDHRIHRCDQGTTGYETELNELNRLNNLNEGNRLVNRRKFIGKTGAAIAGLAFVESCGSARANEAHRLSEPDRFNYIIGTQTFSPLYQFTKKPRLIETAQVIRQMGSSVIKLRLRPEERDGPEAADNRRLGEVAEKNAVI